MIFFDTWSHKNLLATAQKFSHPITTTLDISPYRVQQQEKEIVKEAAKREEKNRERSQSKSPLMPRSPKRTEKCRSSTNLAGSRLGLSLEAPMKPREFTLSNTNLRARSPLETVGRRLSHGDGGSPPPRLGSNFGGSANLRVRTDRRNHSHFTRQGCLVVKFTYNADSYVIWFGYTTKT